MSCRKVASVMLRKGGTNTVTCVRSLQLYMRGLKQQRGSIVNKCGF